MPERTAQKPPVILIVDDNPDNLRLLFSILNNNGYDIRPIRNGRAALSFARSIMPDLILLDIMMPPPDGYEICRRLKSDDRTRDIPVIFISALNEVFNKVKAFSLGGVDYVAKPFQKEEVLARVDTHLSLLAARRALQEKNARLRDEIRERESAQKELQKANAAKSEFLAGMSHEIRGPMNAILGYSQILAEKTGDPRHRTYAANIYSSGKLLMDLINDLLDLSKIEAGKIDIQPEPVNLRLLINEIFSMFVKQSEEKGVAFSVDVRDAVPDELMLDELRVKQILINLIGNAVKFTSRGRVGVRAAILDGDDRSDRVKLDMTVTDTGMGIPRNEQDVIFEAFRQQKGQKILKYGGTGLGLNITKRLVDLMGGEIRVASRAGEGSAFQVILPDVKVVKTGRTCATPEAPTEATAFEPAVILAADDLETNRLVLKTFLEDAGLSVIEAESGEHALSLLRMEAPEPNAETPPARPDLILMDLKMPGISGIETAEIIRNSDAYKDIPIVAVTASAAMAEEAYFSTCFDGLLMKPLDKAELIRTLGRRLPLQKTRETETRRGRDAAGVSDGLRKRIPHILRRIEKRIIPRWEAKKASFFIDDILDLARDIRNIGEESGLPLLADYGGSLHASAETNDIDAIETAMDAFPDLVHEIINLQYADATASWPDIASFCTDSDARTIDLQALAEHFGFDDATCREMLRITLKDISKKLAEIRRLLEDNDNASVQAPVHAVKSMAANICAKDLYTAAMELETAAADSAEEETDCLLKRMEEEYERLADMNPA